MFLIPAGRLELMSIHEEPSSLDCQRVSCRQAQTVPLWAAIGENSGGRSFTGYGPVGNEELRDVHDVTPEGNIARLLNHIAVIETKRFTPSVATAFKYVPVRVDCGGRGSTVHVTPWSVDLLQRTLLIVDPQYWSTR
jgi:hypothetical protein